MNLCLRNSVSTSLGVEDGVNETIISHDWGWVEDGAREELWVWADLLSVGEGGVVTRVEVVNTSLSTNSVSTGWKVNFTGVSEVWSLGSEVGVGTITRWVSHDVFVVGGWVEVLEDGSFVTLETVEVLKPVSPVLHSGIQEFIEASQFSISCVIELI